MGNPIVTKAVKMKKCNILTIHVAIRVVKLVAEIATKGVMLLVGVIVLVVKGRAVVFV